MNVLSVGAAAYLKPTLQAAPQRPEPEPDADSDGVDAANPTLFEPGEFAPIGSTVDVRA